MSLIDCRPHVIAIIMLLGLVPALGQAAEEGGEGPTTYPGYVELKPAVVVNLGSARSYLRVDIQCLVETPEDAELLDKHMPLVRDRLISLLGGRSADQLRTTQQRDDLRAELLADIRDTLLRSTGKGVISAIYFTGFIIQ